jgi:hypothetical protein
LLDSVALDSIIVIRLPFVGRPLRSGRRRTAEQMMPPTGRTEHNSSSNPHVRTPEASFDRLRTNG